MMPSLRKWWQQSTERREIRRWLRSNDAAAIAASNLFALNRYAREWHSPEERWIYELKSTLIQLWYERGLCQGLGVHKQTQECWDCNGTGKDEWHDYDTCWKCGGTGIYRETILYVFRFQFGGKRYSWHQPSDLVTYPIQVTELSIGEYQTPRITNSRPCWNERYQIAIAEEYLRLNGKVMEHRHLRSLRLKEALYNDLFGGLVWKLRHSRARHWWQLQKLRWQTLMNFLDGKEEEQNIPF